MQGDYTLCVQSMIHLNLLHLHRYDLVPVTQPWQLDLVDAADGWASRLVVTMAGQAGLPARWPLLH
jgi:hypothetical protein